MADKLGEIRPLLVLGPDGVNLELLEDFRVEGEVLNLVTMSTAALNQRNLDKENVDATSFLKKDDTKARSPL